MPDTTQTMAPALKYHYAGGRPVVATGPSGKSAVLRRVRAHRTPGAPNPQRSKAQRLASARRVAALKSWL